MTLSPVMPRMDRTEFKYLVLIAAANKVMPSRRMYGIELRRVGGFWSPPWPALNKMVEKGWLIADRIDYRGRPEQVDPPNYYALSVAGAKALHDEMRARLGKERVEMDV